MKNKINIKLAVLMLFCAGAVSFWLLKQPASAIWCDEQDCYYAAPYHYQYQYQSPYDYYPYEEQNYYYYQSPYPYEQQNYYYYQYQSPYGYQYQYQSPYGYQYQYQSPYGYQYQYQSPYGYQYQYQSPYSYQYQYQTPYPTPFNYSLSNTDPVSVTKGSSNVFTQKTVTKTLSSGTTQPVDITSLSGVPSGVSYSIASDPCNPTCSSTITFTVSSSAPVGTHPITVNATPLNKTLNFNLVISGAPITVSCSASPTTALLGQTVTWTGSVSGGTPPLTYSWSGTNIPTNPAPSTNPYSRTYSTIGTKTAQLTVRDTDGVQTTCPAATVIINFDPEFEEF